MINFYHKDKNEKKDSSAVLPYDKGAHEQSAKTNGENGATTSHVSPKKASDSEFLLSIAGMFASGTTDTSERVKEHIAEILRKKYL